jgi:oligopeptide/dipeptide ABC transporter ATP-binding protein
MYAGRVVERATKRDLLRRPLHPYTRGLIGSRPGSGEPQRPLPSIPGMPPSLGDLPPGCRFHPRCDSAEQACRAAPPPLVEVEPGRRSACLRWAATGAPA